MKKIISILLAFCSFLPTHIHGMKRKAPQQLKRPAKRRRIDEKNTGLHQAVINKNLQQVTVLSNSKILLDAQNIHGNTALHIAVLNNNIPIATRLIQAGASPHIQNNTKASPFTIAKEQNNYDALDLFLQREFPLHYAVNQGNITKIKEFLKNDYVNQQNHYGATPLHVAKRHHNFAAIRLLRFFTETQRTPLHNAIIMRMSEKGINKTKCDEEIKELLENQKLDINQENVYGQTALYLAVFYNNLELVEQITNLQKCDIDKTTPLGYTPLCLAAGMGFHDVFTFLLNKGAQTKNIDPYLSPLYNASKNGHIDIVKDLLKINPYNSTVLWKSLHIALSQGHAAIATILIDAGAELSSIPKNDQQFIIFLDFSNQTDIAELSLIDLLNHASSRGYYDTMEIILTNIFSAENLNTALEYALLKNQIHSAKLLIKKGANPTKIPQCVLKHAAKNNYCEVINLLLPTLNNTQLEDFNLLYQILKKALKYDNIEIVESLLKHAPTLAYQLTGSNILTLTAKNGSIKCFKKILDFYEIEKITSPYLNYNQLLLETLEIALQKFHEEIAFLILCTNISIPDEKKEQFIKWAKDYPMHADITYRIILKDRSIEFINLYEEAEHGYYNDFEALLANYKQINPNYSEYLLQPLEIALKNGRATIAQKLLDENISIPTESIDQLVRFAQAKDMPQIIIDKIFLYNKSSESIELYKAAQNGNIDVFNTYFAAYKNTKLKDNNFFLDLPQQNDVYENTFLLYLLEIALKNSYENIANQLLSEKLTIPESYIDKFVELAQESCMHENTLYKIILTDRSDESINLYKAVEKGDYKLFNNLFIEYKHTHPNYQNLLFQTLKLAIKQSTKEIIEQLLSENIPIPENRINQLKSFAQKRQLPRKLIYKIILTDKSDESINLYTSVNNGYDDHVKTDLQKYKEKVLNYENFLFQPLELALQKGYEKIAFHLLDNAKIAIPQEKIDPLIECIKKANMNRQLIYYLNEKRKPTT